MGKRKSAKKPGAGRAKAKPLDKTFKCLFCQHVGTVSCKMDKPNRIGRLDCKDCLQSFQAAITPLDEPVDLYSEWIDACEAVNSQAVPSRPVRPSRRAAPAAAAAAGTAGGDDEDDDEDLPEIADAIDRRADDVQDDEAARSAARAAKMQELRQQRQSKATVDDEDED